MLDKLKDRGYEILFESHAVAILQRDFPSALDDLESVLEGFEIPINGAVDATWS